VRPMLDDVELPQVQSVTSRDVRALSEYVPVGGDGSVLQDLGRAATEIVVVGVATDDAVQPLVTRLDGVVRSGTPVSFVADVTAGSRLQQVLVEDASFAEVAGRPDEQRYLLVLREHIEPVLPGTPGASAGDIDAEVLGEAAALAEGLAGGLNLATDFATGLERFLPALSGMLDRLRDFQQRLDAARQ
jgi:hypothetical protein